MGVGVELAVRGCVWGSALAELVESARDRDFLRSG